MGPDCSSLEGVHDIDMAPAAIDVSFYEEGDLLGVYARQDAGVRRILACMAVLGIDLEPASKRINYDLHPARKPEERGARTRGLNDLQIVYLHLHEYIATLIKCLELLENGCSDVSIFHHDANLRKKAIQFAKRTTSAVPSETLKQLLILDTDLRVLRTLEEQLSHG